ncbi:hypothetical protein PLANTIT3_60613 [Plantibacter sp. T3]|nr:hypothetical protein PLANTIT3_60613 [Plantibacter sp. T3]
MLPLGPGTRPVGDRSLRHQDSNLDRTAPKAAVLPLHYGGPPRETAERGQFCHGCAASESARGGRSSPDARVPR